MMARFIATGKANSAPSHADQAIGNRRLARAARDRPRSPLDPDLRAITRLAISSLSASEDLFRGTRARTIYRRDRAISAAIISFISAK